MPRTHIYPYFIQPFSIPPPSHPTYQTFDELILDLQVQLSGFLQAQLYYIHRKLAQDPQRTSVDPAFFVFEGKFSVVADPAGGDIAPRIQHVRRAIEKIIEYKFECVSFFFFFLICFQVDVSVIMSITNFQFPSIRLETGYLAPDGGIVGRFACVYAQVIPHPHSSISPLPSHHGELAPNSSKTPEVGGGVMVKLMAGSMEIGVSWDRRNQFLPGICTTVSFSLGG